MENKEPTIAEYMAEFDCSYEEARQIKIDVQRLATVFLNNYRRIILPAS